jgi:DNA-binding MarR family transcriptional regulator
MLPEDTIPEINELAMLIRNTFAENTVDSWLNTDLTACQLKTLLHIESKGNVSIKEIVKALRIAQPNATRTVDSLIKERLVTRKENPKDRRLLILNATAKGEKLITALKSSHAEELITYLKKLDPEELHNLRKGLSSLSRMIQRGKARAEQENISS